MSEGDKTAVRYSFQATHLGDGLGVPVTNQKVHGTGIAITRWRDGRWIEGWNELDVMGLMQQIGAAAPTSARA